MILPKFHCPMFLKNLFCFSALIRSYKDANVLLPLRPIFASGCKVSSNTWYSKPIAEPLLDSASVTKYFMPLFAPGVNLNSNDRSNAPNCSLVIISPPLAASAPLAAITFNVPFSIAHPCSGKLFPFALFHPLFVFQSNNKRHPSFFS